MNDLAAINGLREAAYGAQGRYTEQQFLWGFYDRHPEPGTILVLDDQGRLAGTQAVLPVQCRHNDRLFWTGKSEETLLDPTYRGRGLFGQMYDALFRRFDDSLEVIWGMTDAAKPFRKVGFSTPATMRFSFVFTGPPVHIPQAEQAPQARLRGLANRAIHRALTRKTRLMLRLRRRVPDVVERVDFDAYASIWRSMAAQFPDVVSVERSRQWLEWRIGANPRHRYRMLQWASGASRGALIFVIHRQTREAVLVDAVACGDLALAFRCLVARLVAIASDEGVSRVGDLALDVSLEPQMHRHAAMKRYGALSVERKSTHLVERVSPRLSADEKRFAAQNWYYTYLMSDGRWA